jgi:UDP-N-acetylglucosamine 1-carboxyvinyltransferase
MDRLHVRGGRPLEGTVQNAGAKNACLSILSASLLTKKTLTLSNLPALSDVDTMLEILQRLGTVVERETQGGVVRCTTSEIADPTAPWDLVRKMRASFEVLGPLLGRCGRARVSYPGGCLIGVRPVDTHLRGLEALGARVRTEGGNVVAEAPSGGLRGGDVYLGTPAGSSVGATRNVLMAAVLARGTSVLSSAACEPEVVDLAHCLQAMGADIEGAGSPTITVRGVDGLDGAEHAIIPDRIEAGTFLVAGALTGGRVRVEGVRPDHHSALLDAFVRAGVPIEKGGDWIETQTRDLRLDPLRPTDITTQPYPGFPTDLQAQWMALMLAVPGVSIITETIFEDRYMHLPELARLGASVRRHANSAIVCGGKRLSGANLMASDLRASAALVLAGLIAEGKTTIHRVYHLDRGYQRIEVRLGALGATIRREQQ